MAEYVTKEEMERYVEQMTQRYVSQKEIGAYTGMSAGTINKYVRDKGFPQVLIEDGGRPKYDKVAVDKWMEQYRIN